MSMFLFVVALVFVGLAVVMFVSSLWFQSYFYERTVDGLSWRAAAAAAAVTAVLGLWSLIEAKSPGRFDSPFSFGSQSVTDFEQFTSEKSGDTGKSETPFRRRTLTSGHVEYIDAAGRVWKRSDAGVVTAVIVVEAGERRFAARLDPGGNFIRDKSDPNKAAEVEYVEEGGAGRVMRENSMGRIATNRLGPVLFNLAFNFAIAVVWFALLWQLLEYQRGHALLLAVGGWLVTCLLLWPILQSRIAELSLRT